MNELGNDWTVTVNLELEFFVELLLLGFEGDDHEEEVDISGSTWGFLLFAPFGDVWGNVVVIVSVNSLLKVIDGRVVSETDEVTEFDLDV